MCIQYNIVSCAKKRKSTCHILVICYTERENTCHILTFWCNQLYFTTHSHGRQLWFPLQPLILSAWLIKTECNIAILYCYLAVISFGLQGNIFQNHTLYHPGSLADPSIVAAADKDPQPGPLSEGHIQLLLPGKPQGEEESPAVATDVIFRGDAPPHWSLQHGAPPSKPSLAHYMNEDDFLLPPCKIYKGEIHSFVRLKERKN